LQDLVPLLMMGTVSHLSRSDRVSCLAAPSSTFEGDAGAVRRLQVTSPVVGHLAIA
jgi:hypothetical protein